MEKHNWGYAISKSTYFEGLTGYWHVEYRLQGF